MSSALQEHPCWIIETRWSINSFLPKGKWETVMDDLLSTDALEEFRDCLAQSPEACVEYRARLHPDFGYEVRTL